MVFTVHTDSSRRSQAKCFSLGSSKRKCCSFFLPLSAWGVQCTKISLLLYLAWGKQLIVPVCSGKGRSGKSSGWAGKVWTILRMCVGHNFRRLVKVHLLYVKMSWQELTARLWLRILVWLFWRPEPAASEENTRNLWWPGKLPVGGFLPNLHQR